VKGGGGRVEYTKRSDGQQRHHPRTRRGKDGEGWKDEAEEGGGGVDSGNQVVGESGGTQLLLWTPLAERTSSPARHLCTAMLPLSVGTEGMMTGG
jgi:hypothetical protein